MRLVDRSPKLDAAALAARFVPPPRFRDVRFDGYIPDGEHPSQEEALVRSRDFSTAQRAAKRRRFGREKSQGRPGLYLDGGFGVGKTHLLASMWHEHPSQSKRYLTFTELTAFIGFSGMSAAIAAFTEDTLVCIDEFELDDVANTLMVVTFLRSFLQGSQKVAVTSNTLPDRLGEDRFSASEFRREIKAIADHFDELRIDGPDFRTSHAPIEMMRVESLDPNRISHDIFPELLEHLRHIHPVQYGAMLDGVEAVEVNELHTLESQDDALRVVQFIDKLYDAHIPLRVSGCDVDALFHESYRSGGYRKKYGRAESRLVAMKAESQHLFRS